MTSGQGVSIEAPAKINLGLEIIRKRPDGFHEIRTVLVMLTLADTLHVYVDEDSTGLALPNIPAEDNLISRALGAFRKAAPQSPTLGWSIEKRIPVAAGLGGASSDAAAALLAANELARNTLSRGELTDLADGLGSDVPFFLDGPAALASGRGTDLAALPAIDQPVILLVPTVSIPEKTRTLYSMIRPEDMSDGARSTDVKDALSDGRLPEMNDLANAFSRPLADLILGVAKLRRLLHESGVHAFGLSGAGPAHYVIGANACRTLESSGMLDVERDWLDVIRTRTRLTPLHVAALAFHD
ncbi:MAG: 4-(cytidine 5'-diphospho)-2-C-methyl-D-erythritol kinase [Chloroflexia bacterium]|nr:4-(cytidine 5'-diphospho)-2-C-methyl-D-erythritol kinase [Chloroflexia bacterium]